MPQPPINFKTTKPQTWPVAPSTQLRKRQVDEIRDIVSETVKRIRLASLNEDTPDEYNITIPTTKNFPIDHVSSTNHPPIHDALAPAITKTPEPWQEFKPIKFHNRNMSMVDLFRKPIPKSDHKPSTLYLFTRTTDPGYVKIGTTTHSASVRQATIRNRCRYTPQIEVELKDVPFAARVEILIHKELEYLGLRRSEDVCRFGSVPVTKLDMQGNTVAIEKSCRGGHREWFELAIEGPNGARILMERWASFMRDAAPYHANGTIKHEWDYKFKCCMAADNKVLGVNVLLAMWSEMCAPHMSHGFNLVNRQIKWLIERERRVRTYEAGKYAHPHGLVMTHTEKVAGDTDSKMPGEGGDVTVGDAAHAGCCRSWFTDCPGESISIGCANLDHYNRWCAYDMICDFTPLWL